MTASGHLYWTVGLQDPVLPPHGAYAAMQGYVAEADPADPLVSPVFCDYTELIPLFRPVPRDRPGVPPVANAERLLQRDLHLAGKLRAGMILAQVATPSQQMRETGLMGGRGELAIRRPAIAHQHAGVLGPEDGGGLGKAPAGLNGIHRRLRRGEGPQPVAVAVDPPARFIRNDHGTATNRLAQSDIGWPRLPGRPMQGAGHGARGDRHGKPIAQQRRDLAVRQPELLIELHHQRHGLRAELHTRRPQRIRGLQRMPALQASPAGRTPTDRHVEATDEGSHIRELFLILRGDAGHRHRPGTMRTRGRQADRNHVVDRRRPRPLAMPAIVTSGSPPRPARMTTRRALRERGRRPFRRAARQVEFLLQPLVLASQSVPLALQSVPLAFETNPVAIGPFQLPTQPLNLALKVVRDVRLIRHIDVMPDPGKKYK